MEPMGTDFSFYLVVGGFGGGGVVLISPIAVIAELLVPVSAFI
jgi:hypothetical protein